MITHAEAQEHLQRVRDVIVRNGDLRAVLGTMDKAEATSVIESLKKLKEYVSQKQISNAEFQNNAKVVREVIFWNGDLRVTLEMMDDASEAESVRKSLDIVKRYQLQMKQWTKQMNKQIQK